MELKTILFYCGAPLIGALIGYVTNYIAIKMLFRPLTEKRIGPVRIPFTPGILPRQRYALARNIGRMVSRELITGEVIQAYLEKPESRQTLYENVSRMTTSVMSVRLGEISEYLPVERDFLRGRLSELIRRILVSDDFRAVIRGFIERTVVSFGDKPLRDIFPDTNKVRGIVEDLTNRLLSDEVEARALEALEKWLIRQFEANTPLEDIIPEELIGAVVSIVNSMYPQIYSVLMQWLDDPDTRIMLRVNGSLLMGEVLNNLNSLQRVLVSAGGFDKTLENNLPAIIDSLIEQVRKKGLSANFRNRFITVVSGGLDQWRSSGVADAFEDRAVLLKQLRQLVRTVLVRLKKSDVLAAGINDFLETKGSVPLKELVLQVSGRDTESIAASLYTTLMGFLSQSQENGAISGPLWSSIEGYWDSHPDLSLNGIIGLTVQQKETVDLFAAEKLSGFLGNKTHEILGSLNIQKLVEDRVNELAMEDVERLILMIIKGQLKWINLFGALLGALIGGAQVILNLFTTTL